MVRLAALDTPYKTKQPTSIVGFVDASAVLLAPLREYAPRRG